MPEPSAGTVVQSGILRFRFFFSFQKPSLKLKAVSVFNVLIHVKLD